MTSLRLTLRHKLEPEMRIKNHVGKFTADRTFLFDAHRDGINLFDGVIVLDQTVDVYRDRITFTGLHHAFREIEIGDVVPSYRAIISTNYDDDGRRSYTLRWEPE